MSKSGFDFVADEDFRRVLESDRQEMRRCAESESWKAVHVLAGSIIEAVLLDYLVSEGHLKREQSLNKDLGTAIEMAAENSIVSEKVSDLASVVRGYRNLVHPGRAIRTEETPGANSAHIVMNVLAMILAEIGGRKRKNYGYTAEQVVSKVEHDPSAGGILKHLVNDLNEQEIKRLLHEVIPERYFRWHDLHWEEGEEVPSHLFSMLPKLFRTAFDNADENIQSEVTRKYVRVLKEESVLRVSTYCLKFFTMSDLKHLPEDDVQLVKEHFLEQIRSDHVSDDWIRALSGIGPWVSSEEVSGFVDRLIKIMIQDDKRKDIVFSRIDVEYSGMKKERQKQLLSRIDDWEKMYENRNEQRCKLIRDLEFYIDIPF